MLRIAKTERFMEWLSGLRDLRARSAVQNRLVRLERSNLGDVGSVGLGVSEMRIHHGPGYRVYFTRRGRDLIVLLGGGDKSTQAKDIRAAIKSAADF